MASESLLRQMVERLERLVRIRHRGHVRSGIVLVLLAGATDLDKDGSRLQHSVCNSASMWMT